MTSILFIFYLLDIRSVFVFLTVFLLIYDFIKNKRPNNFPPGPRPLPFIGDLHRLDFNNIHLQFSKFAEKYGDIFSVQFIGPWLVVLNGHKLAREAYVLQGENFADRPSLPVFVDLVGHKGVVSSNGYAWKQQRRFALHTLRNFGLGKRSLEPSILQESRYLNEAFANEQGKPFDPQWLINNAVSNIICLLVFGDRYEYSSDEFQSLLKNINEGVLLEFGIWSQLYNMFPWLFRRVPGPHRRLFTVWNEVIDFVRKRIEDHRVDYDPSSPRDYIDCFLAEMGKWKDDEASGFDIENLCFCTLDLFVAGTETSSTTLYWALLYMITYPEIQRKVQEELDRVVGSSRQPSLADRENLPYSDAVIHEIQRFGNIIPLNLGRCTTKDTQIGDYTIPKGTMVLASLTSVLFDETEWETPHTFNPGHFLDAEGKFMRREAFLPFSIGKRACLGEQLARMELFLFFTSLLHRFSFSAPEGVEPSLEFRFGVTRTPQPYQLCAVPR
ncbi:cytochrome P450 2J2-like isoform X1 [Alosa pseudoharengus]|uniref:cytochrome P450 2J2-like isoform X1 n=1 Tax=Alosa pseudoharengus TaxID=34774 RepID=UPI003F888914